MSEALIKNFEKYIDLSPSEKEQVLSYFDRKILPKKNMLLNEGEICRFEAYFLRGCARMYYTDSNGFDVTVQFALEDWWASDIASFHEQKPSDFNIETLEECEVLLLYLPQKERLLKDMPKFERYFRLLIQRHLCTIQDRIIHTIAKSATERYVDFLQLYPNIPQRVAQHYIASYLGISPEFVSKIRKRLATK